MLKLFGTALGAGVTSAVLIAVTTTHTLAGLVLAQLAPLPIMIVGLGFPPAVGAAAALVGAGAIALSSGPLSGLLFLAFSTLPAWLLAYLAARPGRAAAATAVAKAPTFPAVPANPAGAARAADPAGWTPVSTLALALAAAASLPVLVLGAALIWRLGGYGRALARASRSVTKLLAGTPLPGDIPVDTVLQAAPIALAVGGVLVLGVNLYLAGRSVQLSGWLARPWPNLPDGLRLPRAAVGVLAVLGVAVLLPDPYGLAAAVVAGALGMAFAFEGLAAVHVLTRRLSARAAVLAGVYLAVLAVEPWPLLALVLAGCIDCLVPQVRRGAAIKITKLPKRRQ